MGYLAFCPGAHWDHVHAGALLLIRLGLPGAGAQRKKAGKDKIAWADEVAAGE